MVWLSNGIEVIQHRKFKHVWISITDFGSESDHTCVPGISHLLEHVLINCDVTKFDHNGMTFREGMVFYCDSLKGDSSEAVAEIISWFFHHDGSLKVDVIKNNLEGFFAEIENEFYYRDSNFKIQDVVYILQGMEGVMCGRYNDFYAKKDLISAEIENRLKNLNASQIKIMVSDLNNNILNLLENSFGRLQKFPYKPYSYPTLKLPEQKSYIDNIVVVTGAAGEMALFELPDDEVIISTAANMSLISHDVDFSVISGKPYMAFYFSYVDELEVFLSKLKNGIFELNLSNEPCSPESVSILYGKTPKLAWDIMTKPHYSRLDINTVKEALIKNFDKYGSIIISISSHGFDANNVDNKGLTYGVYSSHMAFDKLNPEIAQLKFKMKRRKISRPKLDTLVSNDYLNVHLDKNLEEFENRRAKNALSYIENICEDSDIIVNNYYSNLDDEKNVAKLEKLKSLKKIHSCKVCDYKQFKTEVCKSITGTFDNFAPGGNFAGFIVLNEFDANQVSQYFSQFRTNIKVKKNVVIFEHGVFSMADQLELNIRYFRNLCHIYFKFNGDFDMSKALLHFPNFARPEIRKVHLDKYNYNYSAKNKSYIIHTPFNFLATYIVITSPTFVRNTLFNILRKTEFKLKEEGLWYENMVNIDGNAIYCFSHTITPLKASKKFLKYFTEYTKASFKFSFSSIISQESTTFNFDSCPVNRLVAQ
ncbi:putative metalloprotease [Carp edema virus]|nr:putative metalloprotease [Carp edema virus]